MNEEDLNKLRQTQLNIVDKVQDKNLSHLKYDESEYTQKWSHITDDTKLTFEEKIEFIKTELIFNDCVLVEDNAFASGISVWIIGWFFNREHLKFLR